MQSTLQPRTPKGYCQLMCSAKRSEFTLGQPESQVLRTGVVYEGMCNFRFHRNLSKGEIIVQTTALG
eukprot:762446-Hanusia_phi.AAC.2